MKALKPVLIAVVAAAFLAGCSAHEQRVATGAGVGAAAGAVIGGVATGRAGGALAGAAIGAVGGAIVADATAPRYRHYTRCWRNAYGERICRRY